MILLKPSDPSKV